MSGKSYDVLIKLLLIGDSGVGKSSLLLRFCQDQFTPSFIATLGIDFKIRDVELDGKTARFQVWDTAGQERFKTITTAYYRSAMGFLLVYDVTDEASFTDIKEWYENVQAHARENIQMILVANKSDMTDRRVVSPEQGRALADELGIPFIEASAKTAASVDDAFFQLARLVKERMSVDAAPAGNSVSVGQDSKGTSGCC